MSARWTRRAFLVAPVMMVLGLAALKLGWNPHRGLPWSTALPLWAGAHLVYIAGYLAFGVVLRTLWTAARDAARTAPGAGAVDVVGLVGAVGLIAVLGQMLLDLVIGFRAGDRAAMGGVADSVQAVPGVAAAFYGVVPAMQPVAVGVLVVVLAVRRRIPGRAGVLFGVGFAGLASGIPAAMLLGDVVLCVALPPAVPGPVPPRVVSARGASPRRGGTRPSA